MSGAGSAVGEVVVRALAEDLEEAAAAALAMVPDDTWATAGIVVREPGVLSGVEAARLVFDAVDDALLVSALHVDGERVEPGAVVLRVEGSHRSILTGERTALNLLGHLSGVATLTARFVAEVDGTGATIRDTRSTLPGLAALQRAAVVAGGGHNHRGPLVTDTAAAVAGGVGSEATTAPAPVQVRVDSLDALDRVLAGGIRAVLLTGFALEDLPDAVQRCREWPEPVLVEATGGVTLENAFVVAASGVDAIAVPALTVSAPFLDLGLHITATEG